MKTAIRILVSLAYAALLSAGIILPTQAAGRSTIAPTGEAAVEQMESTEGTQVVGGIIGIPALGYAIAYNDSVSRAKSDEATWSMWSGSFNHVPQAAASVSPTIQLEYLGWGQGFEGECRQHSYCYNG